MALVRNTEGSTMFRAIKSESETSSLEQTSGAQGTSQNQEIADGQNQTKAAIDFATARKSDGQLQAVLLKDKLLEQKITSGPAMKDTAARLDVLRDGNLKGLEKEAAKFAGEQVGVIKDNLGKDIARHDGPGIADMFKMGSKQGLGKTDPLADVPLAHRASDNKAFDMPFKKNDPSLASDSYADQRQKDGLQGLIGGGGDKKGPSWGEKFLKDHPDKVKADVDKVLKDAKIKEVGEEAAKKAKEGDTKYIDPEQSDSTKVEKPKDRPLGAHDRLGHKIDAGNTLVPEFDPATVKKVVEAHKGLDKNRVHMDPDQLPMEIAIDPANPPRVEGDELKNTGNPNDRTTPKPQPAPPKGGDKPHTDGEGAVVSGSPKPPTMG